MALGWESVGQGFEPQRLQATFDPRLPKKSNKWFPAKNSVPLINKKISRRTLKNKKKYH